MIVEWVVQGLAGLVSALFGLFGWSGGDIGALDGGEDLPSSWFPQIGNYVPITLIVSVALMLLALQLGVFAYRGLLHVYSLVPFV